MKPNETALIQLVNKLQEQILILDKKIDTLISRSLSVTGSAPKPPVMPSPAVHAHKERLMYAAVCADCKKECQIPFKPNGDRPVYCQECFKRRKSGGTFKPRADEPKKDTAPVMACSMEPVNPPEPLLKNKKKPASAKKPQPKKKIVVKKKKK